MTIQEIAGMAFTMCVGSLIARKFKTREKSAAWFESLKLDWVSGVGLAVVLVLGAMLIGAIAGRMGY